MKINIKTLTQEAIKERDYRQMLVIDVDGERLHFSDGEPEDANLHRDFADCWGILPLLKKVYEAGKRGEDLEILEEEVTEI